MSSVDCGPVTVHWLEPSIVIGDDALQATVHPSEWARAQSYGAKSRRDEYLRSRYALRWLSGERGPLPASAAGAPTWPTGWVGSLTHKDGYVGVALLPAAIWLSVGIDAEDPAKMREAFAPRLCRDAERLLIEAVAAQYKWSLTYALTILFSFKESLFKAHFPLGEQFFYFHDAEVTAVRSSGDAGVIEAILHLPTSPLTPAGTQVEGHFRCYQSGRRNFVLTAVGMPRGGAPRSGTAGNTGKDITG